ncbi:MAG: AlpA family transcriptional regulator [Desulfobacterales bacterium]|nr:MAG: AlpA family transcriptional regulator [Desulfobacterales bacterium]
METSTTLPRILRKKEVLKISGKSESTLYRDIRAGSFPAPVRLGENSIGWKEESIRAWLDDLPLATA